MPLSFPNVGHLHNSWGGPPGPRGSPRTRSSLEESAVGPTGGSRTRGSAPQLCSYPKTGKTKWHWAKPRLVRRATQSESAYGAIRQRMAP